AKMKRGYTPQTAGSLSAGLGAAMRAGPLGAIYRDRPDQMSEAAMQSSLATHADIRPAALAFAVAFAVSRLVAGQSPADLKTELPKAVAACENVWLTGQLRWVIDRTGRQAVSRSLEALLSEPVGDDEELRKKVAALARPHLPKGVTRTHPNKGF